MTQPPASVLAFDVDNTLLDADMRAYESTLSAFLSLCNLNLDPQHAYDEYEYARSSGNALVRIGLRNPIDERGNPEGVAVFFMLSCANPDLRRELGIRASDQDSCRALVSELVGVDKAARRGSFELRLDAECRVREFCATDQRLRRFSAEAKRIAAHPKIVEWSQAYRDIEERQPVQDLLPIMETLSHRGVTPLTISEGRTDIQINKLDRVGLRESFRERTLITESAVNVPGMDELKEAISRLLDDRIRSATESCGTELKLLWHYHCLIDSWSSKTPSFYARCLHAIRQAPESPEQALACPRFVPHEVWAEQPLYFVMVGDRYDKDVEPLIDLLGPEVGMKIRLRMGKYGHLHPEDELAPDRRPTKTFTNWDSLAAFLTSDLSRDQIEPITAAPDIVNRADVRPDYIKRGLDSPYEAVRTVARAVADMMR